MRNIRKYIGLTLTALAMCSGFTACQDDIDAPDMTAPVATLKPNTTIAELKLKYWNDEDNYIEEVKLNEAGEHIVISGRVISDDAAGNIFRSLIIQDETAALSMSIYSYNLYLDYRIGQEVVIDVTGMYMGKYSTLQQLGFPEYSAAYGWQASFMPREFFDEHSQLNGFPQPAKIDTLVLDFGDLDAITPEGLRKYQSQLVRFNNVHFEEGGKASFCTAHKVSSTDRVLLNSSNASINVRTSGYANFWSTPLPEGSGDVVGIITSYYDSKEKANKYRLQLRSTDDLLNFGNPTLPKGTETNPYSVAEGIEMIASQAPKSGWFTGYIVGSLKAGVQTVSSPDDILWGADAEVNNTLVIGQNAESKSLEDCMLLRLPQGSPLREYGNLRDVPSNYQKQIWIMATPGTDLGMNAFNGNTGAANEFRIEDVTIPGGDTPEGEIPEGDGSEAKPYNPAQVLAMGKNVNTPDKWVSGYIVGYVPDKALSEALFTVPASSESNILLATTPDETDYTKCLPIQLVSGTNPRAALNLKSNPGNLKKVASVHGQLIAYFGVAGVKNTDNYKIAGGGDTPTPPTGETVTSIDQTFEGGTAIPAGWSAVETSGNAKWFIRTYNNNNSAEITAFGNGKNPGANGFESWLVSPGLNVDGMSSKTLSFKSMVGYTGNGTLEVFALTSADPATAQATKLNATIPAATGSWGDWVESGSISLAQFSGTIYIGFRYSAATGSNYTTYRVDDVKAGEGSGGGEEPNPPVTPDPPVTGANSVDFSIFAGSDVKNNVYTDRSADGWTAKWCALATGGGDNVNSMVFPFLESADTYALVIDGSVARQGSLTSPAISGGISRLSFNYGFAFSEKKCAFTVNIKQGREVKASKTETLDSIEKLKVYTFTMDANVKGDFEIEILNNAYSQTASGNKDRVAVWNMSWDN